MNSTAPPPISEHVVDPHQLTIVDPLRDWDSVATSSATRPSLTASAAALLSRLDTHGRDQGWNQENLAACRHTLRVLLAHLGADAPMHEADVRSVAIAGSKGSAQRALHFLAAHHAVIADPTRQVSADEHAIQATIASLPTGIADEITRWVEVQRGLGRRRHPSLDWAIIRRYLFYAVPVLCEWAARVESLREITPHDVAAAVAALSGNAAQGRRTALRSIFRALKQERMIFQDPTRGPRLTAVPTLPSPLSSDALRGLLDRLDSAMARLVVALVAVHALGIADIRNLRLTDLDATGGRVRLTRRRGRNHLIYLDARTHQYALDWLKVRYDSWPRTENSHLLITSHSAISPTGATVAATTLRAPFRVVGTRPSQLRQDRILHEAALTADPVHLIRLFGISPGTAMRYVSAAHPERHA